VARRWQWRAVGGDGWRIGMRTGGGTPQAAGKRRQRRGAEGQWLGNRERENRSGRRVWSGT
jgi:hypothetical protein